MTRLSVSSLNQEKVFDILSKYRSFNIRAELQHLDYLQNLQDTLHLIMGIQLIVVPIRVSVLSSYFSNFKGILEMKIGFKSEIVARRRFKDIIEKYFSRAIRVNYSKKNIEQVAGIVNNICQPKNAIEKYEKNLGFGLGISQTLQDNPSILRSILKTNAT